MRRDGAVLTACALAMAVGLSACTLQVPDPPDFGVRLEGGGVVIAYPRCPSEEVVGATIYVSSEGEGQADGVDDFFETKVECQASRLRRGEGRRVLYRKRPELHGPGEAPRRPTA